MYLRVKTAKGTCWGPSDLTEAWQKLPVQGEWKCPDCMLGRKPLAAKDATPTAREELLSNRGWLALARIERAWRAPDGERWVQLRWYEMPEATHMGRQVGLGHDSICALF